MRRIVFALVLTITVAAAIPALQSSEQETELMGAAGQTLALPEVSTFGGLLSVGSTAPLVSHIGGLSKGYCVNRRVILTTGCKAKMTMLLIGDKNSAKVQKKIVRGTSDFNGTLKAKFNGELVTVIYKQSTGTCNALVDDKLSSGANC